MDADQLVVVDLAKRSVMATLNGFDRVHDEVVAPDIGRVYATIPGRREVVAIDARSLAVVAQIGPIGYPNGLAYAQEVQRVFASECCSRIAGRQRPASTRCSLELPSALPSDAGRTSYLVEIA